MSPQMSSPVTVGDGQLAANKDGGAVKSLAGNGASGNPDLHTSSSSPLLRRSTTLLSRSNMAQNGSGKDKDARSIAISRSTSSTTPPASAALDPLSTQIFLRTNSGPESPRPQRVRNSPWPDSALPDTSQRQTLDSPPRLTSGNGLPDTTKERKKGTSFLSRLAMRGAFKRHDDDTPDSDSELGDLRTDGSSARAPTSVLSDGGGYIPLFKEPPRYIRVKPHNTKHRNFNRLFLAQELLGSKPPKDDEEPQARAPATAVGTKLLKAGDAIWAAEFSVDGRYLAVAGKDQVVRVFAVISTEEERRAHEEEEARESQGKGRGERLSAPVFRSKPVREFEAHTGEVLALCWSKNNFLLSTSMDKTVRLWHISREECLATFQHSDLVTSIAFHPTDDRFFLAGSLDAQLRLWSIPDRAVAFSASTNEFITAVAFSPDGKTAICGVLSGLCWFFETEGFKLQFQIHVRSSRGKNAKGSKITGIKTAAPENSENGDVKVLISSNDSRVRIYSMKTRMLEVKFKGLENQSSQIHARFSDDGAYVISGSEDRRAYMWPLNTPEADVKDKQPYECFDAHPEVVTTALIAPTRTKQLLSASGDPIFDLCNPPPVLLRSLEEAATSQTELSESVHTEVYHPPSIKKPEESPAYIERSKHLHGHIIVTTDRTGTIKVFRQDCAYRKRQQNTWEMSSSKFSIVNGLGRSGSIITRTSGGTHSRRTSLNSNPALSAQIQHPADRIMSWRQDVDEFGRANLNGSPMRNDRSSSPRKAMALAMNGSTSNLSGEARKQPFVTGSPVGPRNPTSPSSSVRTRASLNTMRDHHHGPTRPPTPSFSLISVVDAEEPESGEGSFWNLNRWRGGISGLRYSMNASPGPTGSTSNDATAATAGGLSRKASTLRPAEKAAGRRSLGVAELSKLKATDDKSRRKSAGPTVRAKSNERDVPVVSVDETAMKREVTPLDKRTDSGLGRLSGDWNEMI